MDGEAVRGGRGVDRRGVVWGLWADAVVNGLLVLDQGGAGPRHCLSGPSQ